MKILKAKPNGSCLFISLRLGLEYKKIVNVFNTKGEVFGLLDGFHPKVCESAEKLRDIICSWYSCYLNKELPNFGKLNENADKKWTRGDILLYEAHNIIENLEVPDDSVGKTSIMLRYLKHVSTKRTWGGAAEYIAFAFLSKLNIEVYQMNGKMIDSVKIPEATGTIKLLFSSNSHYDLIVDDEDVEILSKIGFKHLFS